MLRCLVEAVGLHDMVHLVNHLMIFNGGMPNHRVHSINHPVVVDVFDNPRCLEGEDHVLLKQGLDAIDPTKIFAVHNF